MIRSAIINNERGTAAIEFALVGPVFLLLLMGALTMGLLLFSVTSLEAAVQGAARCAAIVGKPCARPHDRYQGMTDPPVFTATTRPCGTLITARTSFALDLVVWREDIPLTASACG